MKDFLNIINSSFAVVMKNFLTSLYKTTPTEGR